MSRTRKNDDIIMTSLWCFLTISISSFFLYSISVSHKKKWWHHHDITLVFFNDFDFIIFSLQHKCLAQVGHQLSRTVGNQRNPAQTISIQASPHVVYLSIRVSPLGLLLGEKIRFWWLIFINVRYHCRIAENALSGGHLANVKVVYAPFDRHGQPPSNGCLI